MAKKSRYEEKILAKPPDGGWGWFVVASSFMIHLIADGVTYTFGIFYVELLKHFESSKGLTAWVPSIMTGMTYGIGPVASGLTNKYGCRAITIAGTLFASLGLLLSIFAPNVITLFFTIGICAGTGFGLIYLPAIVSVTCYFEKKRAFATGIAVCGSGIGSAIFAPLTEWLIQVYGWRGAMLIISAIILNCCFFGALFRPLHASDDDLTTEEDELEEEELKKKPTNLPDIDNNSDFKYVQNGSSPSRHSFCAFNSQSGDLRVVTPLKCKEAKDSQITATSNLNCAQNNETNKLTSKEENLHRSPNLTSSGLLYRKDIFYSASLINLPQYRSNPVLYNASMSSLNEYNSLDGPKVNGDQSKTSDRVKQDDREEEEDQSEDYFHCSKEMRDTFSEMMDFSLLKNPVFLMFTVSNLLTSFGYYVPHIYIKDRTIHLKIASDEEASNLLGVIGIASTVGRVLFGYLSDLRSVNRLWLYNVCLTLCGLSTMLSSFAKTYFLMALYCCVFGLTCGAYVSLTSVILVDLLGLEKLTNAFGLLLLFQGLASLVGPPVVGWMYDIKDSYDPGFTFAGLLLAISGLMLFLIPCISRMDQRRRGRSQQKKPPVVIINCN